MYVGSHPLATTRKDPEEFKTGVEGFALGFWAEAVGVPDTTAPTSDSGGPTSVEVGLTAPRTVEAAAGDASSMRRPPTR